MWPPDRKEQNGEKEMRRVLRPEWVLTERGLRKDVDVVLDAGVIIGITEADCHRSDVEVLSGHLLLPGLVNAHSHAFQRAFRGHVQWRDAQEGNFWSWRERMYAVANALDTAGVRAVTRLCFLEMAEAGITHVGEFHYLQHRPDGTHYDDPDHLARVVIEAALSVGIRITLLRVAYLRGGPGKCLAENQRRFGDPSAAAVLEAIARLSETTPDAVSVGLAPHSVRAVSREELKVLSSFAGVVHAHVAEQPTEVEGCFEEYGVSPLRLLHDTGLVSNRFTAVHLTHPSPGDIQILRAADAAVCVCPSTELDLGDGLLPLEARFLPRLSVGSDEHAQIDLFHEARTLELHGRAQALQRVLLTEPGRHDGLSERLLRAATVEGSRCLGGAGRGIAAGAPADMIAVDLSGPAAVGMPPLVAAAFNARPEWVREVWVGGRRLVHKGWHADRTEVVRQALPYVQQR
jgi:formimidoylglutamate deiminase